MVVSDPYGWWSGLDDIGQTVFWRGDLLGCSSDGWLVIGYAFHRKRRKAK